MSGCRGSGQQSPKYRIDAEKMRILKYVKHLNYLIVFQNCADVPGAGGVFALDVTVNYCGLNLHRARARTGDCV